MFVYTRGCPQAHWDFNTLEMPTSVYLKITNNCCFQCPFCSAGKANAENIDFAFVQEILNLCKKNGVQTIFYTGGEPLLHPHIVEITKVGQDLGMKQVLLTNGYLLDTPKAKSVLENINVLGVSLHGTSAVHDNIVGIKGAFHKILISLDAIHRKYNTLQIGINCTLTENNRNINEIRYLALIAQRYKGSLNISRLNFVGKATTNFKIKNLNDIAQIIEKLKRENFQIDFGNCISHCLLDKSYNHLGRGCSAGITSACIEVNGDFKICPSSSFSLGNLKKESLGSLWNSKKMKKFRFFDWLPPQCTSCSYFQNCKAGCKVEIYENFSKKISDVFVNDYFSKIWDEMCNKKYSFSGAFIRKDFFHYTIISPNYIRQCNKAVLSFIKKISGTYTCKELIEKEKNKEECKNLLIALKIDMFLKESK